MTIEASLRLPQGIGDVDRFIQEFQIGKEAEATSFHTLVGHRHGEIFTKLSDFEPWKGTVRRMLELTETATRKVSVQIAIENHQDFQVAEWVVLVKLMHSPQIGLCPDTSCSLGFLEFPLEAAR